MTYLWINPVSERMISAEALERMLEKHALTRVVCRENWGEIVLRKYRELLEHADGTFADARCPAAVSLVHSLQPEILIADIEPWNRFLASIGEPMEPAPDASPIPPGFFKDLPFPVVSKSGRPAIESYVTRNEWKDARLIELLYCVQGCHRGDGVR